MAREAGKVLGYSFANLAEPQRRLRLKAFEVHAAERDYSCKRTLTPTLSGFYVELLYRPHFAEILGSSTQCFQGFSGETVFFRVLADKGVIPTNTTSCGLALSQ